MVLSTRCVPNAVAERFERKFTRQTMPWQRVVIWWHCILSSQRPTKHTLTDVKTGQEATQWKINNVDKLREMFGQNQSVDARANKSCGPIVCVHLMVASTCRSIKSHRRRTVSNYDARESVTWNAQTGSVWRPKVIRCFALDEVGFLVPVSCSGDGWVICFTNHLGTHQHALIEALIRSALLYASLQLQVKWLREAFSLDVPTESLGCTKCSIEPTSRHGLAHT